MARIHPLIASITLVLAGSACSVVAQDDPAPQQAPTPTPTPQVQTSAECVNEDVRTAPVDTGSAGGDLLALSVELFGCADAAVVVAHPDATISAARLASMLRAPILLPHEGLDAELTRLDPETVYEVTADPAATATPETSASPGDGGGPEPSPGPAIGSPAAVPDTGAPAAGSGVERITASEADTKAAELGVSFIKFIEPAAESAQIVSAGLPQVDAATAVWLVDASEPALLAPLQAMAATAGAAVVPVDGSNLLAHTAPGEAIRAHGDVPVRPVGAIAGDAEWELNLLASGNELPGGGYLLFDGAKPHRLIAYYGHPDASGMGALGHQDTPEATYEAMKPLLNQYDTGDAIVVPTFNPIATVAHNGGSTDRPGDPFASGGAAYVDYSTMHAPSRFAEYVEYAGQIDGYVTLDFQPGRNDFLYQVQQYEELLLEPNVGIALDPEWRLGPDEEHLEQIGSVPAAELNETINYVADLVRDNGLPQKLVLLHQFRLSMIEDRETLVDRDEVAIVIQMDGEGQGGLSLKDDTWRAITRDTEDAHWDWGWKNFFERDTPGPNSPEDTLSKEPQPVYVSYQ